MNIAPITRSKCQVFIVVNPYPSLTEFYWLSFADIARAFGEVGFEVLSNQHLEEVLETLQVQNGPFLIELRIRPAGVPRVRI